MYRKAMENEIVPIEVKKEENLQSKSLKVLTEKYKIKYNVRTSMADYRKNDWIINIPLYSISNIEKIKCSNSKGFLLTTI